MKTVVMEIEKTFITVKRTTNNTYFQFWKGSMAS